jgi:hypothetical protein
VGGDALPGGTAKIAVHIKIDSSIISDSDFFIRTFCGFAGVGGYALASTVFCAGGAAEKM